MINMLKGLFHGSHTNGSSLFLFWLVAFYHISVAGQPRVAVIREEGSNGDREMCVSLYMAGFEVMLQSYFINFEFVFEHFSFILKFIVAIIQPFQQKEKM